MDLKNLTKSLKGIIPGNISELDFSTITKIDSISTKQVFSILSKNGIGVKRDKEIVFEDGDKLRGAIYLIKNGALVEEVSQFIEWRDFEGLVAEILDEKGFSIIKNFRMKDPVMEIDVIGIRLGIAMLIDCKHWKKMNYSSLKEIVKKQVQRTKKYVSKTRGTTAVPVIVTLHQEKIDFIDKVPIVPIMQFSSFIDEFYGNIDELKVETEN